MKKRSILLVEDEYDLRNIVAGRLEEINYHVFQASNGAEALEILKTENLDWFALITDFQMPVMDGGELIIQATKGGWNFDRTIIASSIFQYGDKIDRLITDGKIKTLPKPFLLAELVRLLEN